MKKNLFLLAFLSISQALLAQKDPKASAILQEVSKRYANMKSFSASFTQGIEGDNAKLTQTLSGDITVKGIKFYLKTAGQEIFNNGKEMYSYSKEANEANITNFNPDENTELSPTKIYTLYQKGYKYVFVQEVKEGSQFYEVIDLSPEAKDSKIKKVQLKINKKDKSVKSWKVWDKNGKRHVYRLDKFTPNILVLDHQFTFDKKAHPGVEIIDLR